MSDQPQTPDIQDASPPPPAGPMSFGARLRGYFLAGLLVTAPVAITFYLAWIFINFLDRQVGMVLPDKYNPATYLPFGAPGLGLVITASALILIGFLTANYVGRYVHRTGERVLARLPVVRSIYSATKQIFETVFSSQSNAFREAVLFEYPRKGLWTVGFITGKTQGEIQAVSEDKLVNVFVPTTPNPTSGFLLFVPKKDLIPLSMTVEEAIKMVISGGLVVPPDRRPPAVQVKPLTKIPNQTADT
jgi:uncharacterized membrane protein